jgi:divalent metal cation (Fe/Co/Zn/Cd) transporter
MSQHITTAVLVLKTLTLILGGVITFYSYRAYRRTRSRALRALALGFGIVTLGALLAGIVDQLISVDPAIALVVESLFTTVGFAIILYSLYVE